MNWHSNTLHDSKGWIYFGTNRSIHNSIFVVSHTKQRTKKICWVMFVNYNIFIMHFCSTAIMLIWFCKERIEDTLLNLTKYLWFLKHRCFSYMCFTINTYVIVIHTFFSTVRHYKMNIYSFLQLWQNDFRVNNNHVDWRISSPTFNLSTRQNAFTMFTV